MQRRSFGFLVALCVLLIASLMGCGDSEQGKVVTEDQATGKTRTAQYKTADGWTIVGDLYDAQKKPKGVVLLLHQRGGAGGDWHALSLALQQAGYLAFAIDQRGTGRSAEGPGQSGEFAPWDTSKDIEGGFYAMKDKGPFMIVGASYGANNALLYAAAHPGQVRSLVLFSPGINYNGLNTLPAVKKYNGPLLIFHQKGDTIAGDGPAKLNSASASKDHKLEVSDGNGHGVALLNPATIQETVDFIVRTLQ